MELTRSELAVLRAAVRKGEHRCVFACASQLQKLGLVAVVEISESKETAVVRPERKGRELVVDG